MDCLRKILVGMLIVTLTAPSGCQWGHDRKFKGCADGTYETMATQIEFPAESPCTLANADESIGAPPPWTVSQDNPPSYQDISLAEVIQIALTNAKVMRDLGGAVVQAPGTQRTTYDPAIVESDPRFGTEAALSAFDAQWVTSSFWEKNDRALNNEFFGGGTRLLQQDDMVFQTAITKTAATGSQFTIRHNMDYDANNAPGNFFPSAWNTNFEAEIRQPILQGAGVQFNRIAGPNNEVGVYNGILVARLNTDIALSEFELAVRDLMSNVENAYWDLYFGYRNLDAKIKARDAALDTWRKIYALYESGRRGGEAEKEAQAREQYFRFQEEVQNALSGILEDGTRTNNGSPGGTFRTSTGVFVAERKLRVLMGLPPSGGQLFRPSDEPIMAKVEFDWNQSTEEAATRRVELRRQKWVIRRSELELIASKNFLLPKLDAVGRYRWRGFGHDLIDPNGGDLGRFDNAWADLTSGDFQEWQLGFELNVPIGFRKGHSAVQNAELLLARERALLRDQQREVIHELADAIGEMDRAYTLWQTSYNRLVAARQQLGAVQAAYEADKAPLDLFLDAQRRLSEAESGYYSALAAYAIATKNVHFVKGTLLPYDGIALSEGPWPCEAYEDAAELEDLRGPKHQMNYASSRAPVVSWGAFPQEPAIPAGCEPSTLPPPMQEELLPAPMSTPATPATPEKSAHSAMPLSPVDLSASHGVTQASWLAPDAVGADFANSSSSSAAPTPLPSLTGGAEPAK